jgi:hypothetical protein
MSEQKKIYEISEATSHSLHICSTIDEAIDNYHRAIITPRPSILSSSPSSSSDEINRESFLRRVVNVARLAEACMEPVMISRSTETAAGSSEQQFEWHALTGSMRLQLETPLMAGSWQRDTSSATLAAISSAVPSLPKPNSYQDAPLRVWQEVATWNPHGIATCGRDNQAPGHDQFGDPLWLNLRHSLGKWSDLPVYEREVTHEVQIVHFCHMISFHRHHPSINPSIQCLIPSIDLV